MVITLDKIFSTAQIKRADQYTIEHEPITSIELMERAANKCADRLLEMFPDKPNVKVFCGLGNNGGDGLAIARLLYLLFFEVKVYIIRYSQACSDEFLVNEERLNSLSKHIITNINSIKDFPVIEDDDIIIDAIFGIGLNKPAASLVATCIAQINQNKALVIAIDMPSGLFSDQHTDPSFTIVKANFTLSFQFCKLSFLFSENEQYVGDWEIIDIGLSKKFIRQEPTSNYYISETFIKSIIKPRQKFSHKSNYGHAFIITGSYGKMGAAILTTQACLKSGTGLVTAHIPVCGYEIMQATAPEAMVSVDKGTEFIEDYPETQKYTAIGIGPGIGTHEFTQKTVNHVFTHFRKPMVIDADALNIISLNKDWLADIPPYSVLTPHPKEFERLTRQPANNFERHKMQINFSKQYKVFIVLKGSYTCITTPEGNSYFNSTGNPGMAKGGSGDILTGIITSLLAQGYDPLESALLGVYVHGLSGDLAKADKGETGMTATDIIHYLPYAFKKLQLIQA